MALSQPLIPGCYYHLFNRGVNREPIFQTDADYRCFLEKYNFHVAPIMDTLAYCLMGNHFHSLIRVKESCYRDDQVVDVTPELASHALGNCLNAYAKTINLRHGRTGPLFERPFRRILIKEESHLLTVIPYIHRNPQKHGFVDDFREWPWSSYWDLLATIPSTLLNQTECLNIFGGRHEFKSSHRVNQDEFALVNWLADDGE